MNSKIKKYNKVSDELGKLGILNLKRKLNKSEIKEYCEYDGLTKMAFEIVLRDTNKKLDVIDKKFINKDMLKFKIKDGLKNCEDSLNDKTLKKHIFDFRKGICNGLQNILKLLEIE